MQRIILFVVTVLFGYGIQHNWVLLSIISGYGAKYMCSSIFISGFSEEQQRQEDLAFFPMKYATFTVNYNDSSVTGSVFGFSERKAIYRTGLGATLISELTEEQIRAQTFKAATPLDIDQDNIRWPMGDKTDDGNFPSNINQTIQQKAY